MANHTAFSLWRRRHFDHPLHGLLLWVLYFLVKRMPVDTASALGGFIGRTVGPWLPMSKRAFRHIAQALPTTTPEERLKIVRGMWDNLGRVIAEYPHLKTIWEEGEHSRVIFEGREHLTEVIREKRPAILLGAHLANWELAPVVSWAIGAPLALVHRPPNNPYARRLLERMRIATTDQPIPKGREGARAILRRLRKGGYVGLLIDQKLNSGIRVPFFGTGAMTTPIVPHLVRQCGCAVLMTRTERLGGARFRLTILPPLVLPDSGDRAADDLAMMVKVHNILEGWICEHPQDWLWLHRRWPEKNSE